MGNQLVGIAPSQIFPVEHYLTDLPEFQFDISLGSTRFFKVARARSQEGLVVVKVFAIHDPTLPLQSHKSRLEEIRKKLAPVFNCVPFQHVVFTDKAGSIVREYVKYSLYDRISTRPFLTNIEKRWITFQILYALHQCHKVGVCHGDIKLENICVTSWNWILLVDFASFKPTFLPEDNPADYSYFFDTSRRRTCYIAPERFVKGLGCDTIQSNSMFSESVCKPGELQPAMDVFSAGCALLELWNEGHAPFDLSQLLMYCSGEYYPTKHLDSLNDPHLKAMLSSMLKRNPLERLSAEEYLNRERGRLFPEYFYSFLQSYMLIFSASPILPPDEKISRLKKDISNVINILKGPDSNPDDDGSVIIISLVTSCARGLHHCTSKLQSLEIMCELAGHTSAETILDRILPFVMFLCHDQWSRVRASAIHTLTSCLQLVVEVPRSDANIFPEYVLPGLSSLATDHSPHVRTALAQNIASLADTAMRYLEQSSLGYEIHTPRINCELELQTLHEMFQQTVGCLLTDSDHVVKQTLMENGITKLCVFFGKQKANDVILSHMITFLNDKEDTELRSSFFDCIVGVAAYVGRQSSPILTPLLIQGLTDQSEFVVAKCIGATSALAELGLIESAALCEIVAETVVLGLVHPGAWIRLATAGLVASAAKALGPLDTRCKLAPLVDEYLSYPLIQIDKPELLLQALVPPIPRIVFDTVARHSAALGVLQARQSARRAIQSGHAPQITDVPTSLRNLFRRLTSEEMTESVEDQLLKMSNHLVKINKHKLSSENKKQLDGRLELTDNISHRTDLSIQSRKNRKPGSNIIPEPTMNSEWQCMFRDEASDGSGQIEGQTDTSESPPDDLTVQNDPNNSVSAHEKSYVQYGVAECTLALRSLEALRQARYTTSIINRDRAERAAWKAPIPPPGWRARGAAVAHLHEHRAAITRLRPLGGSTAAGMFASASADGCVRLWDCRKMEGRNIANRSKQVYQTSTGGIIGMATCEGGQTVCLVGRDGSLSLLRFEKMVGAHGTASILPPSAGALEVCSIGETMIATVTLNGQLLIYDIRQPDVVWRSEIDLKTGVPTALCVDETRHSWLVIGTGSGYHTLWDLRFHLPISQIVHPTGSRVRRLAAHPTEHSWLISSVQGNNEISMWNLESGSRQTVLWASSAPPLSTVNRTVGSTQSGHTTHSALALRAGRVDKAPFLLAAGTDHRVRFWDLDAPHESYIAVPAPGDICAPVYKSRLIDGTSVVQEVWGAPNTQTRSGVTGMGVNIGEDGSGATGRAGPEPSSPGHRAPITDVALCQAGQCFLIVGASDGLITVWK